MRIVASVILATALAIASSPALAHFVDHPATYGITWSFEPWVLVSLGVAALLYGLGVYRLYSEVGAERVLDRWHVAAFVGGMAVLFIALCSPIDTFGGELFSVHMIQHLLLMLAAPPLLVWSRPAIAFVWAFSPSWRKHIGHFWTGVGFGSLFAFLMRPTVVWVLFVGGFVLWHLPRPYSWALHNDLIHALEHASFFLTSLAFWTLVIEPSGQRRLGYASALLYVAVTAVLCGLPGALMILAPRAFYPEHSAGAAAWGLTLMEDQQLAGLIMWIPAGAIYIGAAAWLFVRMMQDSGRRTMRVPHSTIVSIVVLLVPLLLCGCRDPAQASNTSFGGNPKQGAALIQKFGCGACHTIPGIHDAKGLVGPPLDHMGSRVYVAGILRNTPDNMTEWLRNPQKVVPNNAMPDVGLNENQARDIAAYLETLE